MSTATAENIAPDWRAELSRNPRTGEPYADLANAQRALLLAPDWASSLAFDSFRQCAVFRGANPWEVDYSEDLDENLVNWDDPAKLPVRPLRDTDVSRTVVWLTREVGMRVAPGIAYDALQLVARRRKFHPILDWIKSLEWDGKPRIASWLQTYAGVRDSAYARAVGRWWLVSAIARVSEPGCKADHVLILEGDQGLGKSSLFKTLAPAWFSDTPIDLGQKDGYLVLRGRWIVELAELDSLNRAEASRAKAFFSSSVDVYRPPYGREPVEVARQCVIAGTVNHVTYLRDETGGRRYWPVKASRIDVAALKRDVGQLWAEALRLYEAGHAWWPRTAEERELCAEQQASRYTADVWDERVTRWLRGQMARASPPDFLTISDVLADALDVPPKAQTEREQQRVARILVRLGWVNRRRSKREDPDRKRAYFPPDSSEELFDAE